MSKERRSMMHPQRKSDRFGGFEIKRITCGWSDAEYKTTLYLRLNGRGVARICDCDGYHYKKTCYHLTALEEWARKSKEQGE
ncbi:MAG: hypothetical protein Unbinned627contig1001_18 [Prokaryotic dsDNA virus sp.]|jgi:hypothetical protein|nr:MAG: hypothetical protein Unbinned627contig1001_18 [Prokaryotic dsDNA virus sp.]|tara:strand:- start:2433 stop:2678 length:246 start_codon:yes stop_codon:yes gene_type:complete